MKQYKVIESEEYTIHEESNINELAISGWTLIFIKGGKLYFERDIETAGEMAVECPNCGTQVIT